MINAKELRPGNLVMLNNPKYWPQKTGATMMVTSVYPKHYEEHRWCISMLDIFNLPFKVADPWIFAGSIDEINQFEKFVDPMLLTGDWLYKLGFKDNGFDRKENPKYIKHWEEGQVCLFSIGNSFYLDDGKHYEPELKYIHTLQNCYQILTQGKELVLTIKNIDK